MLTSIYDFIADAWEAFLLWLRDEPAMLAICRKYADANGHYVGELYMYGTFAGVGAYNLVGVSLDSLPLDMASLDLHMEPGALDLLHDFLAPMSENTIRVGHSDPSKNDAVVRMIKKLPRRNIHFTIQNRFVEYVMDAQPRKSR